MSDPGPEDQSRRPEAAGVDEILEGLEYQMSRLTLEPCSPVEAKLVNAVQCLIATLRYERNGPPGQDGLRVERPSPNPSS